MLILSVTTAFLKTLATNFLQKFLCLSNLPLYDLLIAINYRYRILEVSLPKTLSRMLAEIFEADLAWFQEIYDSTPLQPLDTSQAIFPIYLENP